MSKKKLTQEEITRAIEKMGIGREKIEGEVFRPDEMSIDEYNELFFKALRSQKYDLANSEFKLMDSIEMSLNHNNKIYILKGIDENIMDLFDFNENQKMELRSRIIGLQQIRHLNIFNHQEMFYDSLFYPESVESQISPFIVSVLSKKQIISVKYENGEEDGILQVKAKINSGFSFEEKVKKREIDFWLFGIKWKYINGNKDFSFEVEKIKNLA